jgi:hypothetical protein
LALSRYGSFDIERHLIGIERLRDSTPYNKEVAELCNSALAVLGVAERHQRSEASVGATAPDRGARLDRGRHLHVGGDHDDDEIALAASAWPNSTPPPWFIADRSVAVSP